MVGLVDTEDLYTPDEKLKRLQQATDALKFAHDTLYDALPRDNAVAIGDHIMQAVEQCSQHQARMQNAPDTYPTGCEGIGK